MNQFFKKKGPFLLKDIVNLINCKNINFDNKKKIFNINDLVSASSNEITFLNSTKYKELIYKN